jgi:hypothetical protein
VDTITWSTIVGWLVAVFLPLLVGLVTTRLDSSLGKALLLAALNAILAVAVSVGQALDGGTIGDFDWLQAVFQLLTQLAIAWGAYGQFWKPTGVAKVVQLRAGRTVGPDHLRDAA